MNNTDWIEFTAEKLMEEAEAMIEDLEVDRSLQLKLLKVVYQHNFTEAACAELEDEKLQMKEDEAINNYYGV
jgi:hypothetical protein